MGSTPSPFPLSGGLSSIWFQCQRSHRLHGGCVGTMAFSSTLSPKDMSDSFGALSQSQVKVASHLIFTHVVRWLQPMPALPAGWCWLGLPADGLRLPALGGDSKLVQALERQTGVSQRMKAPGRQDSPPPHFPCRLWVLQRTVCPPAVSSPNPEDSPSLSPCYCVRLSSGQLGNSPFSQLSLPT